MRRYWGRIFVAAALLGLANVAVIADMNEAPAPVQSFQQAGSTGTNADQANAHHTKAKPTSPTANTPASQTPASPSADLQAATVLQAELTQLNQNTLQYQQKTDAQLEDFANKNQMMQQQLQQLTQALSLLNQEVVQLKQMNEALHQVAEKQTPADNVSNFRQWLNSWQNKLGTTGIVVTAIVVILLLLWVLWPRRKTTVQSANPNAKNVISDEDDTKVEYDYMGSNESIPAKLNLARAYIAMEDYIAARKVLDEVAQFGNQEQQVQAEDMRKSLPNVT